MSLAWYADNLICPVDGSPLALQNGQLVSEAGRRYPVVNGVPVLLRDDVTQTQWVASASLEQLDDADSDHLDSLGVSPEERDRIRVLIREGTVKIDPVVASIVAHTSGMSYKHLVGKLDAYPIPELRLPRARSNESLLDVGCNWGRWSIAAAKKGYSVVGIDPSLGAVLAAQRVSRALGLANRFVVGDARYLPFPRQSFDVVFSYSVLQHFSKEDARRAIAAIASVLRPGGVSLVQMPNFLGVRSLQHQIARGFAEPQDFDVRYWSVPELRRTFEQRIGPVETSVDCYFGLGLQAADMHLMTGFLRSVVRTSEALRAASRWLPPLKYVADSVYVKAICR